MANLVTNIYPITNLSMLSSEYLLYQIKGLDRSQGEYYQNCQAIIEKLSYRLQNPVTIIEKEGAPYLVVLNDGKVPPPYLGVVRTTVIFERCPGYFSSLYGLIPLKLISSAFVSWIFSFKLHFTPIRNYGSLAQDNLSSTKMQICLKEVTEREISSDFLALQ